MDSDKMDEMIFSAGIDYLLVVIFEDNLGLKNNGSEIKSILLL